MVRGISHLCLSKTILHDMELVLTAWITENRDGVGWLSESMLPQAALWPVERGDNEDETILGLRKRDDQCRQMEDLMDGVEGCWEIGRLVQINVKDANKGVSISDGNKSSIPNENWMCLKKKLLPSTNQHGDEAEEDVGQNNDGTHCDSEIPHILKMKDKRCQEAILVTQGVSSEVYDEARLKRYKKNLM